VFYFESSYDKLGEGKLIGIKIGGRKLIVACDNGEYTFYDLEEDPRELHPLGVNDDLVEDITATLKENFGVGDLLEFCPTGDQQIPEDLESYLKTLGYL
jgi:hypothetical protein